MKWIDNLKTGYKLIGSFSIVILLMVIIALFASFRVNNISDGMNSLYKDRMLPIQHIGDAKAALYRLSGDFLVYTFIAENRKDMKNEMAKDQQIIIEQMNLYRKTELEPEEKTALVEFDQAFAAYLRALEKAISDVDGGNVDAAVTSVTTGGTIANTSSVITVAMDMLSNINLRITEKTISQTKITFDSSRNIFIAFLIISTIIVIVFVIILTRSITSPFSIIASGLQNIGKGELNRDEVMNSINQRQDELGIAAQGLNAAEIYLHELAQIAASIVNGDLTVTVQPKYLFC